VQLPLGLAKDLAFQAQLQQTVWQARGSLGAPDAQLTLDAEHDEDEVGACKGQGHVELPGQPPQAQMRSRQATGISPSLNGELPA